MTAAEAIARAAERARILIEYRTEIELIDESGHAVDVPVVLVDAHGGPWIIHPDPEGILGWLTAQIDLHEDGGFAIVTATYGWLGAGDLEPDRLIANLIEADWLPTDISRIEYVSTRRRTIGGQSADTDGQRTQAPYRSPANPTPGPDEGRKHRWNP